MRPLPASVARAVAVAQGHKPVVHREAVPIQARRGVMNKTEAAYELELRARKMAGEVRWYGFECVKLRLADGAWYCPDFLVELADGSIEAHETKGHMREAAAVRLKVARELHPWLTVVIVKAQSQRGGGFDKHVLEKST